MGQQESQEYVGVGASLEEAGRNLELVLRATRDDTLRVRWKPLVPRLKELVVGRDGLDATQYVSVTHVQNQLNGLHSVRVIL